MYIYIYTHTQNVQSAIYEYMFRADGHQFTFGHQGTQPHVKTILRFYFRSFTAPFTPNHF